MSDEISRIVARRVPNIRAALARHRLVFLQLGAGFDVLLEPLHLALPAVRLPADQLLTFAMPSQPIIVAVTGLERYASARVGIQRDGLGALREVVGRLLDGGSQVCLVSKVPRAAYGNVPGSSLIEDASLTVMEVLQEREVATWAEADNMRWLPAAHFGQAHNDLLTAVVGDLGASVIAALDHSLYEIDPRSADGLQFLSSREQEALRGAGLIRIQPSGEGVELEHARLLPDLKRVVGDLISRTTAAPDGLATVVSGLWYIERVLRLAVRKAAIDDAGPAWKNGIVNGGMIAEILRRAQSDSCPSAQALEDLRDPLEWLTLGELLDIIRSTRFSGLGLGPHIWRKFADQLVPVRNSLSHMRSVKTRDEETVRVWVGIIGRAYDEGSPSLG